MDRLGLGEEALRAENPRLVSCSVTGFGRGEGALLPGYDLLIQAVGGLMSVTGADPTGAADRRWGRAVVDVIAGAVGRDRDPGGAGGASRGRQRPRPAR